MHDPWRARHDGPYRYVSLLLFTFTQSIFLIIYKRVSIIQLNLILCFHTGSNTLLLRATKDREAKKHFGPAPGVKGSNTKPFVRHKGRKFERCKALWAMLTLNTNQQSTSGGATLPSPVLACIKLFRDLNFKSLFFSQKFSQNSLKVNGFRRQNWLNFHF